MSVATNGHVAIKEETTYGVEVTPDVFQEVYDEGVKGDSNLIILDTINGLRVQRRVLPGSFLIGGDVNSPLFPESWTGWILKGIFQAAPVTSNPAVGVYSHVFDVGNANIPKSFTMDIDALALCRRLTGVVFDKLGINIAKNKAVDFKLSILAQDERKIVAQVPSFNDLDPFAGINVTVSISGATNYDVETCDFNFDNGMEMVETLDGTRFVRKAVAKTFKAAGSFTLEFSDMALKEIFWGAVSATEPQNNVLATSLTVTIEQNVVISGGYKYKMIFNFPRVYIQTDEPLKANTRVIQNVAFTAVQDLATDKCVTVTLQNSVASYA